MVADLCCNVASLATMHVVFTKGTATRSGMWVRVRRVGVWVCHMVPLVHRTRTHTRFGTRGGPALSNHLFNAQNLVGGYV